MASIKPLEKHCLAFAKGCSHLAAGMSYSV